MHLESIAVVSHTLDQKSVDPSKAKNKWKKLMEQMVAVQSETRIFKMVALQERGQA